MGNFSVMDFDVWAKPERAEALQNAIQVFLKEHKEGFLAEHLSSLRVERNGELWFDLEDMYRMWFGDQKLALFLAPFVKAGEITLVGDDDERWGYEFDGEGDVYVLEFELVKRRVGSLKAAQSPPCPVPAKAGRPSGENEEAAA
jgi:hypothetical protein